MTNPNKKTKRGFISKPSLYEERIKICTSCETLEPAFFMCSSKKGGCGCFMKIKAKKASATCPKDKW